MKGEVPVVVSAQGRMTKIELVSQLLKNSFTVELISSRNQLGDHQCDISFLSKCMSESSKTTCVKNKQVAASARRVTGNHPDATGMPMLKGRLGANCPSRTAIALSERPKPRRTPTKAPLNGITT